MLVLINIALYFILGRRDWGGQKLFWFNICEKAEFEAWDVRVCTKTK